MSAPLDIEDLRLAVYRAFATVGQVPDAAGLAARLGADAGSVRAGLHDLARGAASRP